MGISTDHFLALAAWKDKMSSKQLLLSDFRRQMLPTYAAMETNEASPIYRYAKRAYFNIDRQGIVKYVKIQPNALDLQKPEEFLEALKASGV